MPAAWRTLAHRDFRWFFAGNACSNLGTWFQNTAQMILAYRLTGSAAVVGGVTCAQFSSALLIGPWAGAIADRMDRRRLLAITQLSSATVAGAMAVLQALGRLGVPLLIIGALIIGVAFTFSWPALQAIVPALVPAEDMEAATAMNGVALNIGRAVAPLLAIGAVTFVGFTAAFVINALSFLVLTYALLAIDPPPTPARPTARVADGFRMARRDRTTLIVLVMSALVISSTDPPVVLGPTLARDAFNVSENWSGLFLAAMGVGIVLAAALYHPRPEEETQTERRTAISLGLLALAVMGYALSPDLGISVMLAGFAGAASLVAATSAQTLLLKRTHPEHAGSIMGVWTFAYVGSRPITSVVDGWLADFWNVRAAGAIVAAPAALAAGAVIVFRGRGYVTASVGLAKRILAPAGATGATGADGK